MPEGTALPRLDMDEMEKIFHRNSLARFSIRFAYCGGAVVPA
jgi:hypothetical protein